jgi:hypothetical protein
MYAIMTVETLRNWWNMLPKIDKSMPRVCLTIIFYTHRAIIPIGTIQALVTYTVNILVTSITNCQVAHITAWFAESGTHRTKKGILGGWRKGVVGMMPMFHANKASRAKVIVFADGACKEVSHGKYCNTRITGASFNSRPVLIFRLGIRSRCPENFFRHYFLGSTCLLGFDSLGGAIGDLSILHESLDQPVVLRIT